MKIYISADMEGIGGIVSAEQVFETSKEYERARKLMTQEVNAAIEGALEAGTDFVLVNDSHGGMQNIIIEDLNPKAQLISGNLKPLCMVEGIDRNFSGAFFVGYHSSKNTQRSILDHSYSGKTIQEIRVNEQVFGETGLNAMVAGWYDVPVILVSGDSAVAKESKKLLGEIETVVTKEGISRECATLIHPSEVQKMIKTSAKRAVELLKQKKVQPLKVKTPVDISVKLTNTACADAAEIVPGTIRVDAVTLKYSAPTPIEAYKMLLTWTTIAYHKVRN